ncbi:MAG: hypothetical protein P8X79_19280 [Reinekea sp.]
MKSRIQVQYNQASSTPIKHRHTSIPRQFHSPNIPSCNAVSSKPVRLQTAKFITLQDIHDT